MVAQRPALTITNPTMLTGTRVDTLMAEQPADQRLNATLELGSDLPQLHAAVDKHRRSRDGRLAFGIRVAGVTDSRLNPSRHSQDRPSARRVASAEERSTRAQADRRLTRLAIAGAWLRSARRGSAHCPLRDRDPRNPRALPSE